MKKFKSLESLNNEMATSSIIDSKPVVEATMESVPSKTSVSSNVDKLIAVETSGVTSPVGAGNKGIFDGCLLFFSQISIKLSTE